MPPDRGMSPRETPADEVVGECAVGDGCGGGPGNEGKEPCCGVEDDDG